MASERHDLIDIDPETGTARATYSHPHEPPSIAIPKALMTLTNSAVTDLTPLYTATGLNPDALDALFDPETAGGEHGPRVTFSYHGFTVTVKPYGRIVLQSETPFDGG